MRREAATQSGEPVSGTVAAPEELSTEIVYSRLRDGILRGDFDPEAPISQVRLAAELGVSRTPLREALRMLQRDGLIDSEPNRRVRIAPLTVTELEQLYAGRILVECLTARLAVAALSADDLAEMRRLLAEMAAPAEQANFDAWDLRHRAFHGLLKKPTGDRLTLLASDLFDHTERYRRVYLAEPRSWAAAEQDHAAIYAACQAGDAARAGALVARHLGRTALVVIAMAAPEHDPVPVREALRMVGGPGGPATGEL
jgi:GntR family transcriptional regulator, rspAB operon transcriptional repressor